jgi:pimeloyl-ACP methyl ester carboxylesterase
LILGGILLLGWIASAPIRRWAHWGHFLQRFESVEARAGIPEIVARIHGRRWSRARPAPLEPALVLVHGVHPEGGEEPRMARLATLFADEGFVVHVPHLPTLAAFEPDPALPGRLARYFEATRRRHGCIGVVAISVGGGVALRALEDTPVTGVLTVGAHADLEALVDYHRQSGGTRYSRQVLEAAGDIPRATLDALSPRRPPRGPVWVLHGEGDPLVPAEHADRLCRLIGCNRVVRTPWLGHTEVNGESPVPVLSLLDDAVRGLKTSCAEVRARTETLYSRSR